MPHPKMIDTWTQTGLVLSDLASGNQTNKWYSRWNETALKATAANSWFTGEQLQTALKGISKLLEFEPLNEWIQRYQPVSGDPKSVGVIMAGNIPLAGFHDALCVLASGHRLIAKMSKDDPYLLPFILEIAISFDPELQNRIVYADQLKNIDAIIATGSNNTSRYFEYYFSSIPHLFRKNRNSVAVLTGSENEYDFLLLGRDIFTYYGLGCRNISKVFVPEGYRFDEFFANLVDYSTVLDHTRYMNNFDYHQALYLLNSDTFLTNNFLILIEKTGLSSPVSVLFYESYKDQKDLENKLKAIEQETQCVVSKNGPVLLGQAQFPGIADYADKIDTMKFLEELRIKNEE